MDELQLKKIVAGKAMIAGVEKYQYIMRRIHQTDVSADAEFQAVYRDFYQIRHFYADSFVNVYFQLLEKEKQEESLTFETILREVVDIQGTHEVSFASKLFHTLDPQQPIWDSVVTKKHFHITVPGKGKDRIAATVKRYERYSAEVAAFLKQPSARDIIRCFDAQYPDSGISDTKKVDFVLWQDKSGAISVKAD